jgi:hypothetical protein
MSLRVRFAARTGKCSSRIAKRVPGACDTVLLRVCALRLSSVKKRKFLRAERHFVRE